MRASHELRNKVSRNLAIGRTRSDEVRQACFKLFSPAVAFNCWPSRIGTETCSVRGAPYQIRRDVKQGRPAIHANGYQSSACAASRNRCLVSHVL